MTEQPADDLRERVRDELRKSYEHDHEWPDGWPEWAQEMLGRDTDAVMAVVQPELDRLKAEMLKAADLAASLVLERGMRQREHMANREELERLRDVLRRMREVCNRWERYGTPELRGYSQIVRAVLDGQIAPAEEPGEPCPCCDFGDHGGPCTCGGSRSCCHHPGKPFAGPEDRAQFLEQAAGEEPLRKQECAHCGREIEHKMIHPHMDGNHQMQWVHVPGGYSICYPQRSSASPRAEPIR